MQTQSMNSEQPSYYSTQTAPQQPQYGGHFIHQNNGRDPQYQTAAMMGMQGYPARYAQPPQFYQQAMASNGYYQQPLSPPFHNTSFLPPPPPPPFVTTSSGPRGQMTNMPYVQLIRPPNEAYAPQQQYQYAHANANIQSAAAMYQQPYYPQHFPTSAPVYSVQQPITHTLPQQQQQQQQQPPPPPPLPSNQSQQPSYAPSTGPQTQPPQTIQQPSSHQPIESHPPASQSSHSISGVQQPIMPQMYPSQPPIHVDKRQRKPLAIFDPVSHKQLELETSNTTASAATSPSSLSTTGTTTGEIRPADSVTDSTSLIPPNPPSTTDTKEIRQKQADFRRDFAQLLGDPSNSSSQSKSATNDDRTTGVAQSSKSQKPTEPSDAVPSSSSRSNSFSRTKSPTPVSSTTTTTNESTTKQMLPGHPGIRTRILTDDGKEKRERSDSLKQQEPCESTETTVKDTKLSSDETAATPVLPTTDNNSTINDENDNDGNDDENKDDQDEKSTTEDIVPSSSSDATVEPPEPTPPLSATASLECVTPPQTPTPSNNVEPIVDSETTTVPVPEQQQELPTPSAAPPNQRLRYDRQELLKMRENARSLTKPPNLPNIDIVINPHDPQFTHRSPIYSGSGSHGGGKHGQINSRQMSGGHGSGSRQPTTPGSGGSSMGPPFRQIHISTVPDLAHRVENPYKPIDTARLDANTKVLRDVKAILNKVTPQTFDKLQKQLEALEVDRYERLEGMITIFFAKAVDEPGFSFLYAKLCKQFQKKQVTVQLEDGKMVTYYFRQILLTRCQKEFENDYRQEIEYDKRKSEVETIVDDEKKYKEESEKLEEDLAKAKRKKLGNIFFIGELFKLQMLTDTIMYDCIEYLLKDKTDEEGLECLCRLLCTIGKELDIKANEKPTNPANKANLKKHYDELKNIIVQRQTSARIRFMIQDLIDLKDANWVARRAEAKPMTIDEIHEQERIKREHQENEQNRERQQRREQNRSGGGGGGGSSGGGNYQQQQYSDSRGSRGSGIKQQPNRTEEDRGFNVNSVRQLQSNDKRNQGPIISFAPQVAWKKGSGIDKKPEEDRSFASRPGGKPPAGPVQQLKTKTGSSQGPPGYTLQRQSSRELARESSTRDRENALNSLKKTTGISTNVTGSSSMTNSREGSRNVSREQSRNASRESSVSERTSGTTATMTKTSTPPSLSTIDTQNVSGADVSTVSSFDDEKILARVHSLIEEYTENYSERSDRPVQEAIEDLKDFGTKNIDQQAMIVRELFTNVFEAKSRARTAVGHLLDTALQQEIITEEGFLNGFQLVVELAPDYAVDIPLIWQYIGEIVGVLVGAPSSNMSLLKPILDIVPENKSKQIFQYIIRYATEFSSKSHLQRLWQSSGLSLNDLFKSIDSSLTSEYEWLSEPPAPETSEQQLQNAGDTFTSSSSSRSATSTPSPSAITPHPDPQLVRLFKAVNDQGPTVTDADIIAYIHEHMDSSEKFYIRNIVLSYLEACLINRDPMKKIQEDIAKKRMTILNSIIEHKPEAEIQAVYAIQNFVSKLEHPPKMARLLFDIFYDEECVSEDAFFEWLKHPDQSETEGHSVVEMSTKDFFIWLQQAETEVEEGEEEET